MEASIGVTNATKRTLESVKPPWMSWSELLDTMFLASDKKQLQQMIDAAFEAAEAEAVEHAKARYHKYRKNQQSLLSGGELKQRLKARRLKEQVHQLSRIMREQPDEEWLSDPAFQSLLSQADRNLHHFLPRIATPRRKEFDREA